MIRQDDYSQALLPLSELQYLHLGIFLSSGDLFDEHLYHPYEPLGSAASSKRVKPDDLQSAADYWESRSMEAYRWSEDDKKDNGRISRHSGCLTCHMNAPASSIHATEVAAAVRMSQKLQNLRTVGWSTFFNTRAEICVTQEAGEEGETTIIIRRSAEITGVRVAGVGYNF